MQPLERLYDSNRFNGFSGNLTAWILMPLLFMLFEQDMAQRCFSGESSRVVSKSLLFSGIGTLLISFIPITFGCIAKANNLL